MLLGQIGCEDEGLPCHGILHKVFKFTEEKYWKESQAEGWLLFGQIGCEDEGSHGPASLAEVNLTPCLRPIRTNPF